jgi:two-component system cell cycle sensor histidine kinase/response regulator CckA
MPAFSSDFIPHTSCVDFIQNAPIAIANINHEGVLLGNNQAFTDLLQGLDTTQLTSLLDDEDKAKFLALIKQALSTKNTEAASGSLPPVSLTFRLSDAVEKSANTHITTIATPNETPILLLHLIDQTEQKNLELRFSHSQKMQAVGQLAGGIAHDFNNLLTAMIGFCDLLLMRHPAGDPSFADIMQVKQNANRAANLVRQLLAFSRKQTLQPKVLDVGDVLAEVSNLIRRLIGENIQMDIVHGGNLGSVRADQGQLEQVLINLAVNARDAMVEGGKLTIKTSNISISQNHQMPNHMHAPSGDETIAAGEYVLLEISDTGTGMSGDIIKNIFEPFYSTKEVGSGTGLGLSTCYGIVKQTGGFIYVASEIGTGTSFYLYFIRVNAEKSEGKISQIEAPSVDLTGKANIMLVEDETPVRIFAARALRNKGYEVFEADCGETALEVFTKHGDKIDLIISDVVMPGMNGPSMILELEAKHSERLKQIEIVFISGYAEDAFVDSFGTAREFHFLAKPFTLKQLAGKVKEVLSLKAKAA